MLSSEHGCKSLWMPGEHENTLRWVPTHQNLLYSYSSHMVTCIGRTREPCFISDAKIILKAISCRVVKQNCTATQQSLQGKHGGYDTINGRRTFRVMFPIPKGRQLHIRCSDSEWSYFTKRISVTQITTTQMAHIEIKWDLVTKT